MAVGIRVERRDSFVRRAMSRQVQKLWIRRSMLPAFFRCVRRCFFQVHWCELRFDLEALKQSQNVGVARGNSTGDECSDGPRK
jgi:hypothetical protein